MKIWRGCEEDEESVGDFESDGSTEGIDRPESNVSIDECINSEPDQSHDEPDKSIGAPSELNHETEVIRRSKRDKRRPRKLDDYVE